MRLFVVGPGRAGRGVARAAEEAGVEVVGVRGRGEPGRWPAALGRATAVFVAVQDRELDGSLGALAGAPLADGAVVLQASGSSEPSAFAALRAAGVPCGTFHPLVALADAERAPALLRGAWAGVDGDAPAVAVARELAARIGAHPLAIPPGQRARYHAAAVFASNFPVVLAAVAERLLGSAGVPAADARGAVRHLLASAAANLGAGGDAADALTGPVARGDAPTVARHLAALAGEPVAAPLYRALTAAAVEVARRGVASGRPDQLDEIAALVGAPHGDGA